MQLTYRGQSYKTSVSTVDAISTGEIATFMGQSYARKQFVVAQQQQPAELTYRGIRYAR